MKCVSWNVNGIRACLNKGFMDFFNDIDADIVCLQETKLQEGQVSLELDGYEQVWNYADKKGYSGTAVFSRRSPLSVRIGLGITEHDHEGRVITLEFEDCYLVTVYTPNAQDGLARIGYRLCWEQAFRSYVSCLDEDKPVIICGDMNVAHEEIDLKNPRSNRGSAGFSDEERGAFGQLLDAGFTDTFRYLHPEDTGKYSWWSYRFHARENNSGWRIDYFLVSNRLASRIQHADICMDVFGSDHCPVVLELGG